MLARIDDKELDANDLVLFARVAAIGSFSRAAEQLRMEKSTVSRRIASLDERFGERLLHRSTRKLTLTDFGLSLLYHARALAAENGGRTGADTAPSGDTKLAAHLHALSAHRSGFRRRSYPDQGNGSMRLSIV
jgi:DNA-binding transcriptional LysR family regulator